MVGHNVLAKQLTHVFCEGYTAQSLILVWLILTNTYSDVWPP